MIDFAKVNATEAKLAGILPALTAKITSLGGAGRKRDLEALYGRTMIAMAVAKGHFKSVTIMRKDKSKTAPIEKYSVICLLDWNGKKTHWMD